MARHVYYSFHYKPDNWRVQQVKNMGAVEGQPLLNSNDWEKVKKNGDRGIEAWIEEQMKGKSCQVVLIGSKTSERRWVKHEIKTAWTKGKGVVGVYVHNLLDQNQFKSAKGRNPFANFTIGKIGMDKIVQAYDPPYSTSTYVYDYIKGNLADWVEEAIKIRSNN